MLCSVAPVHVMEGGPNPCYAVWHQSIMQGGSSPCYGVWLQSTLSSVAPVHIMECGYIHVAVHATGCIISPWCSV
jgi:hypothetical protein